MAAIPRFDVTQQAFQDKNDWGDSKRNLNFRQSIEDLGIASYMGPQYSKHCSFVEEASPSNVLSKPPMPRPSSGKFLNRGSGKLFPSAAKTRIFTEEHLENSHEDDCTALVIHPAFRSDNESQPNTPKSVPQYRRRTQSAKAKTTNKKESQNVARQRPQSAYDLRHSRNTSDSNLKQPSVIDITNRIMPDLFDIERGRLLALPETRTAFYESKPPMYFSKQNFEDSVYSDPVKPSSSRKENSSKKQEAGLKPSVYGLERQRHVYGSSPDLSICSTAESGSHYPYKLNEKPTAKDKQLIKDSQNRSLPDCLVPLLPWLQSDVPQDVIGVDPSDCLVFLSPTDWSDIPEVPSVLNPDDDLPYVKDVTTPRKWNPKKYSHPFFENKLPVEEWVCKHGAPLPENGQASQKLNTIYRQTVRLPRMRTADIVRKEITELENVLKGIGTKDSNCGIVQYQEEITHFKDLLDVTLNMIPERLKKVPEPEDMFGLRKMCEDHDLIIQNIKDRVRVCRIELAELEVEAGIETDRQYFRKRANSLS